MTDTPREPAPAPKRRLPQCKVTRLSGNGWRFGVMTGDGFLLVWLFRVSLTLWTKPYFA